MKKQCFTMQQVISIVKNVAKQELLPRFSKIKASKKNDGSLITEADIAVQTQIESKLKALDKTILFLGEEMPEQQQRDILQHKDKSVWVLDPVDGTTNFSAGIPYYAVSLALIESGEVVFGVVYDPERDECFVAEEGQGAKCLIGETQEQQLSSSSEDIDLKEAVACIDLKRLPADLTCKLVTQHPFRSQRSFGGVALDWCWLATGRFDVYLHGKQNIWDYAAGHFIFSQIGGSSCTLEGEPVFINQLTPRVGIAALNSSLFDEWTDWLEVKVQN